MEHYRPNGQLAQGYFCLRCGAAGMSMMGSGHGENLCDRNSDLVSRLMAANPMGKVKPRFRLEASHAG